MVALTSRVNRKLKAELALSTDVKSVIPVFLLFTRVRLSLLPEARLCMVWTESGPRWMP